MTYYDHYAEGVLFKLSKKSKPVNILPSHGGMGVWNERWVILQGSKLLIHHKRKVRAIFHLQVGHLRITIMPSIRRLLDKMIADITSVINMRF